MSQSKVIIFSNLPQRDRIVDEFLGTKLREKDFEVRVTEFLPRNREHILFYKPDIIIIPETRCEYTIQLAKVCMNWGITVVVRRTEGGSSWAAWNQMEDAERATVIGAWPYDVDLEIVWSKDFKDLIVEHGYLPEEKVFVSGAVSFDPYFLNNNSQRPEGRKSILFATGWGHADRNPVYNVPEAPPGSPIHRDAYERHCKGREAWIKMIKLARKELPKEWDFFLRVKTGEFIKPYQDALLDCNLKVLVPCPAKMALDNTDLLIHAGSTLALEAHLCNMPAISFCGLINQVPGLDYPHVSEDFTEAKDLIEAIKKVDLDKSNANLENFEKLEKTFYGAIDGKACDRIADKISTLELKPTCTPDVWPEDDKEFYTPGVFKNMAQWVCECCHKVSLTNFERQMIKCPHCGISLAKRAPQDEVMNSNWKLQQQGEQK